jgi:hypothetical protein
MTLLRLCLALTLTSPLMAGTLHVISVGLGGTEEGAAYPDVIANDAIHVGGALMNQGTPWQHTEMHLVSPTRIDGLMRGSKKFSRWDFRRAE